MVSFACLSSLFGGEGGGVEKLDGEEKKRLTSWRKLRQGLREQRRVSVVGLGIGDVRLVKGIHHGGGQDAVVHVLDPAAVLVLVPGEELGVAGGGEVKHLGDDAGYALVAGHDG